MKTTLIDARNIDELLPSLIDEVEAAPLLGFDIETQDEDAHDGIKEFRKKDGAKCFDYRRMDVTGFSWYVPGAPNSYYLNLAHRDHENRVPWELARSILFARNCPLVIHNVPFEQTVMKNALDFDVGETICTMQLAVSTFGPDEYDPEDLGHLYEWPIVNLLPRIAKDFNGYDRGEMSSQQAKLLGQVVGKESRAAWSYNGFNNSIAYGYGLKQLVRNLLKENISSFAETLAKHNAKHMGKLTGEQVADYGGADSYYAIKLFYRLIAMIRPEALHAFETQENPMSKIYSAIQIGGCRIDSEQVEERGKEEALNRAKVMDNLKKAVSKFSFPVGPNEDLFGREEWYQRNFTKYRNMLSEWKRADKKPLNLNHYMPIRVLLYDLCGLPIILEKGKVQSDGEARGQLLEKAPANAVPIIKGLNELVGIDQGIKLYLKPYKLLIDPETDKVYPSISSRLATRRLAGSNPNPMQLSKTAASAYVRSFYLPDNDQHGIVSLDLSQIELVLIGEMSQDSQFRAAYGQLPYRDLHQVAGAAVLGAVVGRPDFTVEDFKALQFGDNKKGIPLLDKKGNPLTPEEAYTYNRGNDGGKSANFEFWYSGSLATLAEKRGLGGASIKTLVEAYTAAFPEAVAWRQDLLTQCQKDGFLELPDGHRRVRYEATVEWQSTIANFFRQKSMDYPPDGERQAIQTFGNIVMRKVSTRAKNQLINALIQGSCATILKRSLLRIWEQLPEFDARFLMPVHDELVWSVNYDHMLPFIKMAKVIMTDHKDIIPSLAMDSTVSIGRTCRKFDINKAPFGQIELSEAPKELPFVPESEWKKEMSEVSILRTIQYLKAGK